MTLESQNVPVPIGSGLDQKTDARLVQPGHATALTNAVFAKAGGSVRKRNGYTGLSTGIATGGSIGPSSIGRFSDYRNELVYIDGVNGYSYSPGDTAWSRIGPVPPCVATRTTIAAAVTNLSCQDVVVAGGYTVYSYLSTSAPPSTGGLALGDAYISVVDNATGSYLIDSALVSSGLGYASTPKLASYTVSGVAYAVLTWIDTFTATAIGVQVSMASPTVVGGQVTLASNIYAIITTVTYYAFDVASMSDRFVLAAGVNGPGLLVQTFGASLASPIASASFTDSGNAYVVIGARGTTAEHLYIAYSIGTNLRAIVLNPSTLATVVAATTVVAAGTVYAIGVERLTSSTALIIWYTLSGILQSWNVTVSGSSLATTGLIRGMGGFANAFPSFALQSRPFAIGGHCYALVLLLSAIQGTYFVIDLNTHDTATTDLQYQPVATIAPRLANSSGWVLGPRPRNSIGSVAAASATQLLATGSVIATTTSQGRTSLISIGLDFGGPTYPTAEIGANMHIACGVPEYYDARDIGEIGFTYFPEGVVYTPSNSGGAIVAGTYQYAICYEWIDAAGQLHTSAPSLQTAVVVGGTTAGSVFIAVPNYILTRRCVAGHSFVPPVAIVVYRSVAGGAILYRLTPDNVPTANYTPPKFAAITITDTAVDGSLASNTPLYTTGGVLAHFCPPSAKICISRGGRAWLAGLDDAKLVQYSKFFASGFALGFNDQLSFYVDEGGPITGLVAMDDKLIIFKSDRLFYVTGSGQNDLGQQNDLSDPQTIPSDVGCIEPRSIVATPDGVMFQSTIGIYLLARSLEVQYVGHPVSATLATYPIITSAVLHQSQSQARFTCTSDGRTGVTLVYDTLVKAWSTFEISTGQPKAAALSAVSHQGIYKFVCHGGFYVENAANGDYTDAGTYVPMTVESAWISVNEVQGYQRIRRIAILPEAFDACDIAVSVGFDYADYSQTDTFLASTLAALPLQQIEVQAGVQKCQAVRVRIVDAAPTGASQVTGQGIGLTRLTLRIAAKVGTRKLAAAARG
jgi:hypothetical protein